MESSLDFIHDRSILRWLPVPKTFSKGFSKQICLFLLCLIHLITNDIVVFVVRV